MAYGSNVEIIAADEIYKAPVGVWFVTKEQIAQ
jgi:hypothetical protein